MTLDTGAAAPAGPAHSTARLRRARAAVFGAFFINGFVLAVWVVQIPTVARETGIGNAALGSLLLLMGAGSVAGMQSTGYLAARVGSRAAVVLGALLLAAGAVVLSAAATPLALGVGLVVLGLGNGCIDVAMNDQAVEVERAYRRPIMSAFHATFSIGGAVGSGFGGVVNLLGGSVPAALLPAAAVVLLGAAACAPFLRPLAAPSHDDRNPREPDGTGMPRRQLARRAALLAVLAFAFMLAEGTVNDWSSVHAVQHLRQSPAAASLAYVAFAIAMTIGRLAADRVSQRLGPRRVVRWGAGVAAAGLLLVVVSPIYPVTLVGWVLFGIGLSGIVPQIFTAAGNLVTGPRAAIMLSRVVTVGYAGMLAGPALIGWIAGAVGINLALTLPLLLCAVGMLFASAVGGRTARA
ncbi:MFS transporter [Gryllotalpicola kribbensis]|uniref:MFS transporter n=1 Tax=Gryllotalpicola kribbensis TaxID=993084 RepID=A0ABP8AEG9_9MICO